MDKKKKYLVRYYKHEDLNDFHFKNNLGLDGIPLQATIVYKKVFRAIDEEGAFRKFKSKSNDFFISVEKLRIKKYLIKYFKGENLSKIYTLFPKGKINETDDNPIYTKEYEALNRKDAIVFFRQDAVHSDKKGHLMDCLVDIKKIKRKKTFIITYRDGYEKQRITDSLRCADGSFLDGLGFLPKPIFKKVKIKAKSITKAQSIFELKHPNVKWESISEK